MTDRASRVTYRALSVALSFIAWLPLVCVAEGEPAAPARTAASIAAEIDAYMDAAVRIKHFTGAVLIARDGEPMLRKSYGMANIELGVPNTAETVYRIGSITKAVTAIAIMKLQEQGKLKTSDPICKYLEECPTAWQPITIRHALTHSSGIPNYTDLPGFVHTAPVTHNQLLAHVKDLPLEFAPGEQSSYNNTGFYIAGMIIERVSGASYEQFLQSNIFDPLAMTQSGYDNDLRLIPRRASGYSFRNSVLENAGYRDMSVPFSAGALYSTADDLLKLDQALYSDALLSQASREEMFTAHKDGFGYGWDIKERFGRAAIEKNGGFSGFYAFIARFPADRVTVIVTRNNTFSDARTLAVDLAAIVFGAPYTAPYERKAIRLRDAALRELVGRYRVEDADGILEITLAGGKLMRRYDAGTAAEMFAESDEKFFVKSPDTQFTVVRDEDGKLAWLVVHFAGRDRRATRID